MPGMIIWQHAKKETGMVAERRCGNSQMHPRFYGFCSRKWQTDRELEIRRIRLLRLRRRADLCWPDSGEPKTANRPASDEPADRCRRDERVGPVRGGRD